MKNYKLVVEYYEKGNKQEQIATLCSCSRMTVFTVLKRFRALELKFDNIRINRDGGYGFVEILSTID